MSSETFADDISRFVAKAKAAPATVVRKVAIDILTSVVMRSPVGNPELWAINATARRYNTEVTAHNAALRDNPENLTKNGRLKPGRKLNDGMDIVAPGGYVGGRFRANWIVSLGGPTAATTATPDKAGQATIAKGITVITHADGEQDIYIVNNLPYARALEYGHSKQAPAGMVRITLAEVGSYLESAIRSLPK